MDLQNQQRTKEAADKYNKDDILVILGTADVDGTGIYAETVTQGDPTYAGPLSGVPLGLPVYHILDPAIKKEADPQAWEEHISMMEMVLDVDEIIAEMDRIRQELADI